MVEIFGKIDCDAPLVICSVYASFLGFGPKGGLSAVEHWGKLYVRPSVRPSRQIGSL